MTRTSAPTDRALRLLTKLVATGRMTTAQAARFANVTDDVVKRDLQALAKAGFAAHVQAGAGSAWEFVRDADPRRRGIHERISLLLGRELASFLRGTALYEGVAHVAEGVSVQRFEQKFRYHAEPARDYTNCQDQLDGVLDGLLGERRLRLGYARDGVVVALEVEPLTLVVYRRAVYLLAQRRDTPDIERLAIDRIATVAIGDRFSYPPSWDPDGELAAYFGITASGRPERIVLRFAPAVTRLVTARTWHPTQRLQPLDDGGVELWMDAAGPELVRFVCEWGRQVEVLRPQWLRDAVRGELSAALEQYR